MLDRYELLYEAGLIEEARRDGVRGIGAQINSALGVSMRFVTGEILATAMGRLRAKLNTARGV